MTATDRRWQLRPFTAADQDAVKDLVLAGLADHWGTLDPTLNPDLNDIAGHYAAEAGIPVAVRFAEAVERALDHITRHPATGSLRYGHALNTPGLRFWPLRRFPYLVFYV